MLTSVDLQKFSSLKVSRQGFIQWGGGGGGGGGKLPLQNSQLPPQKEREKEEKRKRREREKERERCMHGGGRGACIFLRRIASDQYSLLLHDSII